MEAALQEVAPEVTHPKDPSARPLLLRFLSHTENLSLTVRGAGCFMQDTQKHEDGSKQPLTHLHLVVSVITVTPPALQVLQKILHLRTAVHPQVLLLHPGLTELQRPS